MVRTPHTWPRTEGRMAIGMAQCCYGQLRMVQAWVGKGE
jgi:hypothetical protein